MKQTVAKILILAVFMIAPQAIESQSTAVPSPSLPMPRLSAVKGNLSAEEVFRRFASRIMFLTCDQSSDESSVASGVMVSADGFIVTNAHVVGQCRSMTVMKISGKARQTYQPILQYYDELSDVAVLKISGQGFDFFDVSAAQHVQTGERVFAIGNPRGFEQSITEGIVSGNRQLDGMSWIQHSAPISPGSSGGALISSHGMLLGINAMMRKESQNLNFAVPAATLVHSLKMAQTMREKFVEFPPDAGAKLKMGLLFASGNGLPKDDVQAAAWIRKAAEQGNSEAQTSLGVMYMKGRGVLTDAAEAVKWIRKAAEQGYARAQLALGRFYQDGYRVTKDDTQAATWIRRAAEQGYTTAQIELAVLYQLGHGVEHDDAEAADWLRKAAELGDTRACLLVASAYLKGVGVPKDYGESYFWLKLAAELKNQFGPPATLEEISVMLDEVSSHISVEERLIEQKHAKEWIAAHSGNR